MKLPNKLYDILKWIAQLVLPAIGTLYFALANIWGFPYGEEIVGTITAIDAFLGVILGINTAVYKASSDYGDGTMWVTNAGGKDNYSFEMSAPIEDIEKKSELTLRVKDVRRK